MGIKFKKRDKAEKTDKTKIILELSTGFLLVWFILSIKTIYEDKYNKLEQYLSDYYYSQENIVTAITNKLGDECEESDSQDVFLAKNFDNYVYQLVIDDINQYESEELAKYNMYLTSDKAEEVLNALEEKEAPEIKLIEDVCYIRIPDFSRNYTYGEIKKQRDMLRESKKFIIDLRDNAGGNIDELINIMSVFYEKGSVVYTQIGNKTTERETKKERIAEFDHIVFLCNENTGSASEVMIHNMKSDFSDKIEIVGNETHGKYFCYSYKEFDDGEMFIFVSGIMANAAGETFGKEGIIPDYYAEGDSCIDKALELLQ